MRQDFFSVRGEGCGRNQLECVRRQHTRHMLERGAKEEDVGKAFGVVGAQEIVELGAVEREIRDDDAAVCCQTFGNGDAGLRGPSAALREGSYCEQ